MNALPPALLALAVAGCCGKNEPRKSPSPLSVSVARASASAPAAPPAAVSATPEKEVEQKATLAEAFAFARPQMADTEDESDKGSWTLARWMALHPSWAAIAALPASSVPKVIKDPETERGRRICEPGRVAWIRALPGDGPKVFQGVFQTNDIRYLSFIAVGSTGEVVDNSATTFCGVVTGLLTFSNNSGGKTQSARVVGMFDLPENRKKK